MHDDGVRLGQCQLLRRQAIVAEVLAGRGQQGAVHALVLQAQHDDHVAILEAFVHVVEDMHAELVHVLRQQRFRADGAHFRHAERGQRMDVGAGDTGVQDVTDDGHPQLREVLLVVTDGVHVEQALRRVGMPAIAGIDDVDVVATGTLQVLGNQVGRPARRMAHDEQVGVHGAQVVDGIEQGLALGRRRLVDVEVDDVGAQTLGGNLEGGAGARRVLEKQVEDALAAQQRHLLDLAYRDFHEGLGGIEDLVQDGLGQAFDGQQMGEFAVLVQLRVMHVPASRRVERHPCV